MFKGALLELGLGDCIVYASWLSWTENRLWFWLEMCGLLWVLKVSELQQAKSPLLNDRSIYADPYYLTDCQQINSNGRTTWSAKLDKAGSTDPLQMPLQNMPGIGSSSVVKTMQRTGAKAAWVPANSIDIRNNNSDCLRSTTKTATCWSDIPLRYWVVWADDHYAKAQVYIACRQSFVPELASSVTASRGGSRRLSGKYLPSEYATSLCLFKSFSDITVSWTLPLLASAASPWSSFLVHTTPC